MSDIPKKGDLVQITDFKIDKNAGKVCNCHRSKKIINQKSRRVYCEECGAGVDPFDALLEFARKTEDDNHAIHRMRDQAQELKNYKPWLRVIKRLEKEYRGKQMLPVCPRCNSPFYLEELDTWTNRKMAEPQIARWREENPDKL